MNCPSCKKEVVADRLFCTWCEAFIPNLQAGKKAGLFRRWFATAIDPLLVIVLYLILAGILGGVLGALGGASGVILAIIVVTIGYGIFFLWFLSKGMTPGKWLMGEQVVEKLTGNYPGFWRMLLRETIGKFISGLFLGLGYFWAIWDKDNQAWHDKIAGTVVVHIKNNRTSQESQKKLFAVVAGVVLLAVTVVLVLTMGGKQSVPSKAKFKRETTKPHVSEVSKKSSSTTRSQSASVVIPEKKNPVVLDIEYAKEKIKQYYNYNGEWAGTFTIDSIDKIRLEEQSDNEIIAHVLYKYKPAPTAKERRTGFDRRVFLFQHADSKWEVISMGEHLSGNP